MILYPLPPSPDASLRLLQYLSNSFAVNNDLVSPHLDSTNSLLPFLLIMSCSTSSHLLNILEIVPASTKRNACLTVRDSSSGSILHNLCRHSTIACWVAQNPRSSKFVSGEFGTCQTTTTLYFVNNLLTNSPFASFVPCPPCIIYK